MKKFALVTGACINTGVAIVEKFAEEGWNVVFTGRDFAKVELAKQQYQKKYPSTEFVGYTINSLLDERTINEKAIADMYTKISENKTPAEVLRSIKAACKELPIYKQITGVTIRDKEFEKTTSNKIKRFANDKTKKN